MRKPKSLRTAPFDFEVVWPPSAGDIPEIYLGALRELWGGLWGGSGEALPREEEKKRRRKKQKRREEEKKRRREAQKLTPSQA